MITEAELEAFGFHKIVWNRIITEYWLPLFKPTGDQTMDMDRRLAVRLNEFRDDPGPTVYLVLGSMMRLPHIKETNQLIQLYELLAGRSVRALAGVANAPGYPSSGSKTAAYTPACRCP